MSYSEQQILDLAPDDSSAKAGLQLAHASKWVKKCSNPKALWGDCQGSGKNPYHTYIDLTTIAFKCSCPSRKFPCKHGLGLLLLYAKQSHTFSVETELPPEVEEWVQKRATKLEHKEQQIQTETKPIDEASAQKRIQAREQKIMAGIEELQTWIKDTIRMGIMNIAQNQYQFNKNIIARMNDAQAPGLAFQLKKMNKINFIEDGWQILLTKQLSQVYLLAEAYKNKDSFEPPMQDDLNSLIGWNTSKEEVLGTDSVNDYWQILAKQSETDDYLTTSSTWLYGVHSQRFALVLEFYTKNQLPSEVFICGNTLQAELCFYPSLIPLRALVKQQVSQVMGVTLSNGVATVEEIKNHMANLYSLSPFVEKIPFIFTGFAIILKDKHWYITDTCSKALQIANIEDECWEMAAVTKGEKLNGFALYENNTMYILSYEFANTFYNFL